jgi:putative peptide zinc metalloprotease protein
VYSVAESTVRIQRPNQGRPHGPTSGPNRGMPPSPMPAPPTGIRPPNLKSPAPTPVPRPAQPVALLPLRAEGLQLLGPYEGSGFRDEHFLVSRSDDQVVHLSALLYHVLAELGPGRTAHQVASAVSARVGKTLTPDGVRFLIEKKLVPGGLVDAAPAGPESSPIGGPTAATPAGSSAFSAKATPAAKAAKAAKANPLLALRLHKTLLSARATNVAARGLKFLFAPVAVALMLSGLLVTDGLLIVGGGAEEGLLAVVTDPLSMLALLGMLLGGTLFHEFGHAAGCRYGGGTPGVIGVGVYVIMPAFYTNVTDAYRLDRAGRLRTDLGGIYFNGIAALGFGIGYLTTGWVPLLLGAFLMHMEALQQCLPLIRSDGYFILADMVGVPDLFGRIRPVLASLLPWRKTDPRVRELRPRVRVVISAWVLVVVPVLGAAMVYLIVQTPAIIGGAITAVQFQWNVLLDSIAAGEWVIVILVVFSILLLVVPIAGLTVFMGRLALQLAGLTVKLPRAWHARAMARGRHSVVAVRTRTAGNAAVPARHPQ